MSGGANEQLRVLETLKRDDWSVAGRAIDASGDGPQLVRRLIQTKRFDEDARSSLRAEVEYGARLDHPQAPRGELVEYPDGELVIRYANREGIELDRILFALNARGWVLTARAAAVMLVPVIEIASTIGKNPPPDMGTAESFGHGEIAPRSLLLGRDGLVRLYEARCAATALPWARTSDGKLCLAPELPRPLSSGTAEGDVYALGAVLASCVVGIRNLVAASDTTLHEAFEGETRLLEGAQELDRGFTALVIRALSPDPDQRLAIRSMSLALRHGLGLDEETSNEVRLGLADLVALLNEKRDLSDTPEDYRHRWSKVIGLAPPRRSRASLPTSEGSGDLPGSRSAPAQWALRGTVTGDGVRPIAASTTDISRGFSLEVLDDWNSMSRHLTGTFTVPRAVKARVEARRRRRRTSMLLAVAIVVSIIGGVGLFFWEPFDPSRAGRATSKALEPESVEGHADVDPQMSDAPDSVPTDPPLPAGEDPAPNDAGLAERKVQGRRTPEPPKKSKARTAPSKGASKMIVRVVPPGRVSIDGKDEGYAPVVADGLEPGEHQIRVVLEGFKVAERDVKLKPGEDRRLQIVLEKIPAK